MSRKTAREVAFKIIFELAFQDEDTDELFKRYVECKDADEKDDLTEEDNKYIKEVLAGVKQNEATITDKIKAHLKEDWSLERISKIDFAILKLAVYEITYREDIPNKVSINEAVELSKVFGEDSSSNFINGVLAEVLKEQE